MNGVRARIEHKSVRHWEGPRSGPVAFAAFLLLQTFAGGAGAQEPAPQESPNVLLIIVDDLRPQLGAYGFDIMHTPNIDRLAEEGFVKPHLPFAAPSRYWDLYDRAELQPMAGSTRPEGTTEIPYIYSELESYRGISSDDDRADRPASRCWS